MKTEKKALYGSAKETMMAYELIAKRRTIRKFLQKKISHRALKKKVDATRLVPSGANLEQIEFIIISNKDKVSEVFCHISWAACIKPEGTPEEGDRPVEFAVFSVNKKMANTYYRIGRGAAAQILILAALKKGIGSCTIGAFNKKEIVKIISMPRYREIEFLIALGYSSEQTIADNKQTDSIRYYKDKRGILHVHKRPLEEALYFNYY